MATEKEKTIVLATRLTVKEADVAYQMARVHKTTVADLLRDLVRPRLQSFERERGTARSPEKKLSL